MKLRPQIHHFRTVSSTNSEAARFAFGGAAEGLCIVADEQTEGRGRLQREWVSPPGAGLYFSILLKPKVATEKWPLLTLMAAVAVHDTLRENSNIQLDIKWPNDLLSGGRKICGILAEAVETNEGRAVILGIGINLTSSAFPLDLSKTATSVEEATGSFVDRDVIVEGLVGNLARYYQVLHEKGGGSQILNAWSNRSSYAANKLVRVSMETEVVEGFTRGLEADGALRVETENGEIKVIRAGDVVALRQT